MQFAHLVEILLLALSPVLLFALVLIYLDSFKLVSTARLLTAFLLGVAMTGATYLLSGPLMDALHLDLYPYSRYVAPALEESLKASIVIGFILLNRVGFMIDAAIIGVAVGAGFAVSENIYYALVFPDANLTVWMIRGLGTAIMHSGTTAIFGIAAIRHSERQSMHNPLHYIPGLVGAIALHAIYNQFIYWPVFSTAVTVFALPFIIYVLFEKSQHEAHEWMLHDFESHEHLLEAIREGSYANSEAGRFIADLARRLPKAHVEDIFAYIRLHTELVLQAEQMLLARERGERKPRTTATHADFVRLRALERKIGIVAMLTLWPHLRFNHEELFELHELEALA
jgi:RsiW-degrading membrane proteinase PrsW (M82 family)